MNSFVHNNEFDKDVILNKLSEISNELEKERSKEASEKSLDRERELMYAQMIQGLKLNTLRTNSKIFF